MRPGDRQCGVRLVKEGSRRRRKPHPTVCGPISTYSVIIPEKLDSFINKFAEYTHEKWAFDKVNPGVLPLCLPSFPKPHVFSETPGCLGLQPSLGPSLLSASPQPLQGAPTSHPASTSRSRTTGPTGRTLMKS